jgi:hypothetical protein
MQSWQGGAPPPRVGGVFLVERLGGRTGVTLYLLSERAR